MKRIEKFNAFQTKVGGLCSVPPPNGNLALIAKNILWKREKSWIYQCHTQMLEVNFFPSFQRRKQTPFP